MTPEELTDFTIEQFNAIAEKKTNRTTDRKSIGFDGKNHGTAIPDQ